MKSVPSKKTNGAKLDKLFDRAWKLIHGYQNEKNPAIAGPAHAAMVAIVAAGDAIGGLVKAESKHAA